MTGIGQSPALLLMAAAALFGGSLVVLTWGRRLPRQGDWVVAFGLLVLVVVTGIGWSLISEQGWTPVEWSRGWILPKEESGAITVGVLRDVLALTFSILAACVAACAMVAAGAHGREERAGRFFAALGLSSGGMALAWFAATPWLALGGIAVVVLGGFLALGSRWDVPSEALIASRFAWERSWGLFVALAGLCVLAGDRAPLSMMRIAGAEGAHVWTNSLGAGLLFFGAVVQLQPFPLLGWAMSPSETYSPARTIMAQVLPAWSVFALLVRLEPHLREAGVFPHLGWFGIASAVFAAIAGIFCGQWRQGLGAWVSTGFSLAVAMLAIVGPAPAMCLAIGLGLGAIALASFASALEEGGPTSNAGRQRSAWAKAGCALAAAAGTGFAGFVSSGGNVRALSLAWEQTALIGALSFVLFLFIFLGWKVAWQVISLKGTTQASWTVVLAPYFLLILSLGSIWTGTLTGGIVPGNPDRMFHSLIALLFGHSGENWGEDSTIAPASAVYWVVTFVALGTAAWTAGRRPEFWPRAIQKLPRFSAFVSSGYGIDGIVMRARSGLAGLGRLSVRLLDRVVWESFVPRLLGRATLRGATAVASADIRLSRGIGELARRWVETPSKALQLIQNGDVQWYLFFAVASGIAIMAHFMRT